MNNCKNIISGPSLYKGHCNNISYVITIVAYNICDEEGKELVDLFLNNNKIVTRKPWKC